MIYLDYSATTPVDKSVLEVFNKVTNEYIGNPNALYALGSKSAEVINQSTKLISDFFHVTKEEIIYTSGATESNNLAIFGVVNFYAKRPKKIITTTLEHASIKEPLAYLEKHGYEILYVDLNKDGTVNLLHLEQLLNQGVCLVTICAVDSEMGIRQPIERIGEIVKKFKTTIFHSDITQALGKININLENVDLASFSGHKIYGLKGIGGLVKKANISLLPIIMGGKSTTIYRSGTPPVALIASLAKVIKMINIDEKKIDKLNAIIKNKIKKYENVIINSTEKSIPQILNFSIYSIKPETIVHMFELEKIYLSSKTACSSKDIISHAVFSLYNDKERASSTIRISLSNITTNEEIEKFLEVFDKIYNKLLFKIK